MNCQKNNVLDGAWGVLKNLPAFRYLKEPVDNVSRLYEKYPDGVERGSMAFVLSHNCFYAFNAAGRIWDPVGGNETDMLEGIKDLIDNEKSARQSADTDLQDAISVAGPDCLVADSMTDLYEKLNTSSWWLNGHSLNGKALIRQIRVFNWFFTLVVTRSEVLTQYLFGPVKLNPDNSFTQGEAYFESYILKRVLFPDGSGSNNKWHYVDRSDFLNVDEYKPRESGYYTAATARAAVVSSLRKGSLVITCRTGENTWVTEQAKGTSNWTDGSNWKAVGSGSGDSGGSGADLPDIEDSIADLAEALTAHTGNTGIHITDLGENPDTDEINTPGCYRYRESHPGSPVRQNYYMTVAGSEQTGTVQFRYSVYGLEKREQDGEGWGDWQEVGGDDSGGSGISDAPEDGKQYARQDGTWTEAQDKRIVILSEEEYDALSGADGGTLYFLT